MRPDMDKILVERPRWGRDVALPGLRRERERLRHDPESARRWQPVSRGRGTKGLGENLAPLVRFLARRVGRPWDEVRSEICTRIAPTNAVQKHVLEHLRGMVQLHVVFIEGWPHLPEARGPRRDHYGRLFRGRWQRFYVCPVTGVLAELPRRPQRGGHTTIARRTD